MYVISLLLLIFILFQKIQSFLIKTQPQNTKKVTNAIIFKIKKRKRKKKFKITSQSSIIYYHLGGLFFQLVAAFPISKNIWFAH